MMNTQLLKRKTAWFPFFLICMLSPALHAADVQYMTTYTGSTLTVCPPYCNNPLGYAGVSISTFGSGTISTPPGVPSRTKCTYGYAGIVNWSLKPTLLAPGATYRIEVAHTATTTATNVLITAYSPDGVMSASCTNSPVFNKAHGGNSWVQMGTITLNPGASTPTIFFYMSGGYVDNAASNGQRLYIDAFKFTEIDPCDGVVGDPTVTGPLTANNTFVNVSGITEGATTVTVYIDGSEYGSTNYASGFAAGTVQVPTLNPLYLGGQVTARQTKNGCTSAMSSAATVGGGANPLVRVSLGLAQNSGFTGPAGANSSGSATVNYWLAATNFFQGSASAPVGGKTLSPDACWYEVSFQWGVDPAINWLSGATVNDNNPFAALDSIAFAIDSDSGPYDIYIDDIRNGDVVIENFEGFDNGALNVTFEDPDYAATPNPAATYLSAPNSSAISQNYVVEGTNACRVQWQFANNLGIRWARVMAAGTTAGKKFPQLDTRKPVTMKILVLPVGGTTAHQFVGTVSNIQGTNSAFYGLTNTLSVTAQGSATYTYSWAKDGYDLGITTPSIILGNVDGGLQSYDAGVYTVSVNDGTCTQQRSLTLALMNPLPVITNQPISAVIAQGSTAPVFTVGATAPSPAGFPLYYMWRLGEMDMGQYTETFSFPGGAQPADSGAYNVLVYNNYGYVTSQVAVVSVLPPGVTKGTGTGLRASYYTFHTNNAPFSGTPTLSRLDPEINFAWGNGSPDPAISSDWFTARWFGEIQALGTGEYTFYTVRDDGMRLWVNGQLVLDQWTTHATVTNSAVVALTGTQKYPVIVEYFEQTGAAVAKLWWSNSFTPLVQGPIPSSQLYPGTFVPSAVTLTAPANPTAVTLPATVNMAATVTANNGLVDKVQFYTNGTLLAEALVAPYTYSWVNPPAGQYSLTARVVYNKSSASESAATTVTVSAAPQAPVTDVTISVASGNATINYSGGAGTRFVLLSTTDLALPVSSWTRVNTNNATPGNFVVPSGAERAFYKILSE